MLPKKGNIVPSFGMKSLKSLPELDNSNAKALSYESCLLPPVCPQNKILFCSCLNKSGRITFPKWALCFKGIFFSPSYFILCLPVFFFLLGVGGVQMLSKKRLHKNSCLEARSAQMRPFITLHTNSLTLLLRKITNGI